VIVEGRQIWRQEVNGKLVSFIGLEVHVLNRCAAATVPPMFQTLGKC